MKHVTKKFGAFFCFAFSASFAMTAMVHAATVNLVAFVSPPTAPGISGLFAMDGTTLLADGSRISIVGSFDGVNDGFVMNGAGNIIYDETAGDDVVLAHITVDSTELGAGGTFFDTTVSYDDTLFNFFYIRDFDTNAQPVTGLVDYGVSAVFTSTPLFGVSFIDFGNVATTNVGFFQIIPEPDVASLYVLAFLCIFGVRAGVRRTRGKGIIKSQVADEKMPDQF
ncbi:MAG: hypothetical protein AAF492_33640 [Verrucomicrobiota bacterium]